MSRLAVPVSSLQRLLLCLSLCTDEESVCLHELNGARAKVGFPPFKPAKVPLTTNPNMPADSPYNAYCRIALKVSSCCCLVYSVWWKTGFSSLGSGLAWGPQVGADVGRLPSWWRPPAGAVLLFPREVLRCVSVSAACVCFLCEGRVPPGLKRPPGPQPRDSGGAAEGRSTGLRTGHRPVGRGLLELFFDTSSIWGPHRQGVRRPCDPFLYVSV